jgi:hypothetical protein
LELKERFFDLPSPMLSRLLLRVINSISVLSDVRLLPATLCAVLPVGEFQEFADPTAFGSQS